MVILASLALGVLGSAAGQGPKRLKSAEFERMVRHFPKDIGFGFSGAAFFQNRLYVSCNLGLVVVSDDGKIELLQWRTHDSVIEGPWLDRASGVLWAQQAADSSLIRFDGKKWDIVPMPSPPKGYFSRGDVLSGFRGVSSDESFWMVGGGFVWRWNSEKRAWKLEPNPPMPNGSDIRAFLPGQDQLIYFVRLGPDIDFGGSGLNTAAIFAWRGEWHEFSTADLHVKQYVRSDAGAYILTEEGGLYEVSHDKPIQVEGPGLCEAIGRTSTGGLLASFANHGVFLRVDESWTLKARIPCPPHEGEHWAHLAEDSGRMVLVTAPVPQLVDPPDKFVNSGTAGIWISEGGDFKRLQIR